MFLIIIILSLLLVITGFILFITICLKSDQEKELLKWRDLYRQEHKWSIGHFLNENKYAGLTSELFRLISKDYGYGSDWQTKEANDLRQRIVKTFKEDKRFLDNSR